MSRATPESKVLKGIIDFLESQPDTMVFRRQAGGFSYKKGLPDLYASTHGIHIEIECKALNGCPSAEQLLWEERFSKAHVAYCRPHSVDQFIDWYKSRFHFLQTPKS